MEEVALGLYVRRDHYGIETNLKLDETKATSDLVASFAGIRVPRNKAIVGQMHSVMNQVSIKMDS